ncbi:MAG: hypothetical protein KF718_16405 [Polyangiaceae bacterium]|nr:hypothetical protein [Polyangiaceae bacterium]
MHVLLLLIVGVVVALLLLTVEVSGRGLLVTALASLAAIPAALFGAYWASGARREDFSVRAMVPWSSLFALLTWLTATLGIVLFGAEPLWLPPLLGWSVAGPVFFSAASLWLLPLRPIFRMRSALGDPSRVDSLARALVASFEEVARPHSAMAARRQANRALVATNVLNDALRFDDAARVLATVPVALLDAPRRAAIQASRTTMLLYGQDRNEAWSALKDAAAHAKDPAVLRVIELTDALLSALDGQGGRALERLGATAPEQPKLRRAWLIARAHALCATGDADAARSTLTELRALAPDGLRRVQLLRGPASALAADLGRDSSD